MKERDYYGASIFFFFIYLFATSVGFFIFADDYEEYIYWSGVVKANLLLFVLVAPSLILAFLFKWYYPNETLKAKVLASYFILIPLLGLTPVIGGSKGVGLVFLGYFLTYVSFFVIISPRHGDYAVFMNLTAALLLMLGLTLRLGGVIALAVGVAGIAWGLIKEVFDEDAISPERKAIRTLVVAFTAPIIYHVLLTLSSIGLERGWPLLSLDLILGIVVIKITGGNP